MRIAISLDVPSLEAGLAFYGAVFGFEDRARPYERLMLIGAADQQILLIERAEGSLPFPGAADPRRYDRHWTPIHLDFHVEDVAEARDRALAAGGRVEAWHEPPGRAPVAFMSDPFGHGFCLIGA